VEVAEQYAEGEATEEQREGAVRAADGAQYEVWERHQNTQPHHPEWMASLWAKWSCGPSPLSPTYLDVNRLFEDSLPPAEQAQILRCVFGNPFRPVALEPAWLSPEVRSLAEAAYRERSLPQGTLDPVRLSVLADALEEQGADGALVDHLRAPGPHVRGCFALDWILQKG
jgi:hypothetical protein